MEKGKNGRMYVLKKEAAGALTSGRLCLHYTRAGVHTHCGLNQHRLLTECAFNFRNADINPLQYIGVHSLGSAPSPQSIQLLLQDGLQLAK